MARKKVTSDPVLRDWAAVDTALRDLKECRHTLAEMSIDLDRRVDSLKDEYNRNAQPVQNRTKRLEADIKEFVDAHRAELDGQEPRSGVRKGRLSIFQPPDAGPRKGRRSDRGR